MSIRHLFLVAGLLAWGAGPAALAADAPGPISGPTSGPTPVTSGASAPASSVLSLQQVLQAARQSPEVLAAQRALNALHDTVRGLSTVEQADAERARRNALAARKTAPEWTPSGAPRPVYGLGASRDWRSASWCAMSPSVSRLAISRATS